MLHFLKVVSVCLFIAYLKKIYELAFHTISISNISSTLAIKQNLSLDFAIKFMRFRFPRLAKLN